MAKRKLTNKLLKRTEIMEDIKHINGTKGSYVGICGNIYEDYGDGNFFKRKIYINNKNGYAYISLTMDDNSRRTFRVHRLVATAFIENPANLQIVGHKDNNKRNNNSNNLYWTTIKENTKKAFDDGCAINAKGWNDSQSIPVIAYKNNIKLKEFGSIHECSRELNIPISTIIRRCKKELKTSFRKYKEYDFEFKISNDYRKHN